MIENFFRQSRPPKPDRELFAKPDDVRYLRCVWFRIGALSFINSQSEAAAKIGVALSTLNRYFTSPSANSRTSCPYPVQFAMECLAGMEKTGQVYQVEATGPLASIKEFERFGGAGTTIVHGHNSTHASITVYIALTLEEEQTIKKYLLEQSNITIRNIRPESTISGGIGDAINGLTT